MKRHDPRSREPESEPEEGGDTRACVSQRLKAWLRMIASLPPSEEGAREAVRMAEAGLRGDKPE